MSDELTNRLRGLAEAGATSPFDAAGARRLGRRRRLLRQAGASVAALALVGGTAAGVATWRPWDTVPPIVAASPSETIATPQPSTPAPTPSATPTATPTPSPASPSTTVAPTPTTAPPTAVAPVTPPTVPTTAPAASTAAPTASAGATTAAQPPTAGPRACLPHLGLCFTAPAGVTVTDKSVVTAAGYADVLEFSRPDLGLVTRLEASAEGGAIGGACSPGGTGTATVVRTARTSVSGLPASQGSATDLAVAQVLTPLPNGSWTAETYLTASPLLTDPGEVDACAIMMADFVTMADTLPPLLTTVPTLTPAAGATKEEARTALAGPVHSLAWEILATASRG